MTDEQSLALNLSFNEQIAAAAKLLGYKQMPVTVEQFIEDDYYLGRTYGNKKLYPYWKEVLQDVFPTPIHTRYPIIVLTGAIGSGKSTFSKICSLYNKHRIACLNDPYATLGVAKGKFLEFLYFHTTSSKAQSDFVDSVGMITEDSPYYQSITYPIPVKDTIDGARGNNSIGGDIIFYVLSELNFVKPDVAQYKLDQAFKRWHSRFLKVFGYFGNIIIDTSARGDDSITDDFINNNPYVDVKIVRASIWEAKAHMGLYGRKGWFKVYAGDSTHSPFIIEDDKQITDEMDINRVITAPKELEADFRFNIVAALQDEAGWSTKSTGKLMENPDKIRTQFSLPTYSQNVITVDFYNKSDKLIYKLDRYLRDIPDSKVIFPRFDIGVVSDNCGIAITYWDKFVYFDREGRVKMPVYVTPLMVALSRVADQETSIYHLFEFVLDLNERFEIGEFSADQYASRQLMQDLEREKIPVKLISVDRTDTPYLYFKNMVNNKLWTGTSNMLAFKELCGLQIVDGKVDHPLVFSDGSKGCFTGDTLVKVKHIFTNQETFKSLKELVTDYPLYKVLSYNEELNYFEYKTINRVWETKKVTQLTEVRMNTGTVYCTEDHKFLTDNGYIEARYLNIYSRLVSDRYIKIEDIYSFQTPNIAVYDMSVLDNNNFVLSTGNVVHNSKDVMDAVCGSVWSCYSNLEKAMQLSNKYSGTRMNNSLQDRFNQKTSSLSSMAEGMFANY